MSKLRKKYPNGPDGTKGEGDIRLEQSDVINAMGGLAADLDDKALHECVRLGQAISQGSITFDIPIVTKKVFQAVNSDHDWDSLTQEETDLVLATRARFALLGYVVRNFMHDGYKGNKGFMDPPGERAANKQLILGPNGLVH